MTDIIAEKISEKIGVPNMVDLLSSLSGSDLSSLLIEVYQQRSVRLSAGSLLQQYQQNSFAQPADTDMLLTLERELEILRYLQQMGYHPLELSPVGQFGSCSVVGTVSQKKIISAIRHTEVMADATNALAIHMAGIRKANGFKSQILRYSTVHRHVRALYRRVEGHTPHFKVACMVAAGRDTGDYSFELTTLKEQLLHIYQLLSNVFAVKKIYGRIIAREGYKDDALLTRVGELSMGLPMKTTVTQSADENNYYKGVQFKVLIELDEGPEIEIADGGFTDWTQKLTGNRKERCLISGLGLSLLIKLCTRQAK